MSYDLYRVPFNSFEYLKISHFGGRAQMGQDTNKYIF